MSPAKVRSWSTGPMIVNEDELSRPSFITKCSDPWRVGSSDTAVHKVSSASVVRDEFLAKMVFALRKGRDLRLPKAPNLECLSVELLAILGRGEMASIVKQAR